LGAPKKVSNFDSQPSFPPAQEAPHEKEKKKKSPKKKSKTTRAAKEASEV
jgi:hypothetical protein